MATLSYAIGPGLYDWERDTMEKEEIRAEIVDQRFESYFQAWHSLNYADLGCVFTKPEKKEKVCKEIAGVMGEAMNRLYWNEADAKEFELLMFKFYCSTGSRDTINAISGLLHKYIKPACRELMKDDWQSW